MAPTDDGSQLVNFTRTQVIPFFGSFYRSLYISNNGLISFTGPVSQYNGQNLPLDDGRKLIIISIPSFLLYSFFIHSLFILIHSFYHVLWTTVYHTFFNILYIFWADVLTSTQPQTACNAQENRVHYRTVDSKSIDGPAFLTRATNDIRSYYLDQGSFTATLAFVVTWSGKLNIIYKFKYIIYE